MPISNPRGIEFGSVFHRFEQSPGRLKVMALRLPRLRVFLLLSILFLPAGMAAVVDVPAFLNVIPGTTTKAEVDLS